jgi:AcrR family transcriptional regulator
MAMGAKERRSREKERREQEIIEGARGLFVEKGFAQTTMDDVVERLEMSKGGLYHHFKSKDELLYAAASAGLERLRGMVEEEMAGKANGLEKVTAFGQAYVRFYMGEPMYRKIFSELALALPPVGPRGQAFVKLSERINAMMVEVIEEGIRDRSIRPDVNAKLLAFSASSSLDGVLSALDRRGARLKWYGLYQEEVLSYTFEIFRTAIASKSV